MKHFIFPGRSGYVAIMSRVFLYVWPETYLAGILKETPLKLSENLEVISLKKYVSPYLLIILSLHCVLYINSFQFIHIRYTPAPGSNLKVKLSSSFVVLYLESAFGNLKSL